MNTSHAKTYPKKLSLPPPNRPHWVTSTPNETDLLYLSWGDRTYGLDPIPVTRHEGWLYYLNLSGKPILKIGNKEYLVSPFEAILVGPECPFGWTNVNASALSKHIAWIWKTSPSFINPQLDNHRWMRCKIPKSQMNELEAIHQRSREEVQRPDQGSPSFLLAYKQILDGTFNRLLRSSDFFTDQDLRFQLATRWMEQHVSLPNPINALQDYLQLSSATLKRLFKQKAGESPKSYLYKLKMRVALSLLKQNGATVKNVSYQLGYRFPNDFTRSFQLHHGITPSSIIPTDDK